MISIRVVVGLDDRSPRVMNIEMKDFINEVEIACLAEKMFPMWIEFNSEFGADSPSPVILKGGAHSYSVCVFD